MPRFKIPDYGLRMIPVDFERQVLPGTFEFALCHLVDQELDLSGLRSRFRNDAAGAPAFDPAWPMPKASWGQARGLNLKTQFDADEPGSALGNRALFGRWAPTPWMSRRPPENPR